MVTCVGGKDKILVSPIIYWTEQDVWEFLNARYTTKVTPESVVSAALCHSLGKKQKKSNTGHM